MICREHAKRDPQVHTYGHSNDNVAERADMAQMWDSGQEEEAPHDGNAHPGLRKSYHMELADQMDKQAGGSAFPRFLQTGRGALISVVVVLLALVLLSPLVG